MFQTNRLYFDNENIFKKLLELKKYWIQRFNVPFYTLGRNAYLDGKTDDYYENMNKIKRELLTNFADEYVRIMLFLEHCLNEKINIHHDYAIPSFHIFKCDPVFLNFPSNWHMDYPHKTLNLGDKDAYSFTYVVKIPSSGAGLEYKDGEEIKYLKYSPFDFILHKGDFLHNIAPLKEYKENEYRITLQGHIIRHNDRLIMYW
jgi:hypothetical protein